MSRTEMTSMGLKTGGCSTIVSKAVEPAFVSDQLKKELSVVLMIGVLIAYVLQVISILLPVLAPDLLFTLIGAVLFGASFLGIVSLVLTMAGRYYPTRPAKMMGKMTISYGLAQVIAPAVAGVLAEHGGNYNSGLMLAAATMMAGSGLVVALMLLQRKHN